MQVSLRFDELSNITPAHMEFFFDHLRVFVSRAKNDVYPEDNYVYIKRLGSKYCPVALLERYMSVGDIDLSCTAALFRPVRLFKSSNTYKLYGTKLSYTRCWEIFKNCLNDVGLDNKLYVLHSLRLGAVPPWLVMASTYQSDHLNFMGIGSLIVLKICISLRTHLSGYKYLHYSLKVIAD